MPPNSENAQVEQEDGGFVSSEGCEIKGIEDVDPLFQQMWVNGQGEEFAPRGKTDLVIFRFL